MGITSGVAHAREGTTTADFYDTRGAEGAGAEAGGGNGERRTQVQVSALLGWHATGVLLEAGASYDAAAVGNWKIAKDGGEYDADGDNEE